MRSKNRDVILPMTVIRRLDEVLSETKEEVIELYKELKKNKIENFWSALYNKSGVAFCNEKFR